MRSLLRAGVLVLAASLGGVSAPVAAQEVATVDAALKSRVERRFRVLPVRDGLVLTPRREVRGLQSIEIRDGVIAVDGTPASGAQLRDRLGADADLVLQVSYLSAEAMAVWAGPKPVVEAPAVPGGDAEGTNAGNDAGKDADAHAGTGSDDPQPAGDPPDDIHWRKSSARVHIGSSIVVGEDELVTDPVVAVGGSVTVLGRVDDDVVAVGGSVRLGPRARVRGDVTAVGGRVEQEKGATIGGTVNEVRIGPQFNFKPWHVFDGMWFDGWDTIGNGFRLMGTVMRVSLVLLLALLVALIAARPVQRIADRVGRDPWLSGFTGLLAQLLFIPVLVLTVVILAVSIIGIPLLLLVPFVILGFLIATLVGFTGVAMRIGRWAVGSERPAFVALAVGVILVSAVALVARTLALLPVPLWPVSWILGFSAFFLEYLAWTVGLGAALLTRFGTRGTTPDVEFTPPPLPMVSGPAEV